MSKSCFSFLFFILLFIGQVAFAGGDHHSHSHAITDSQALTRGAKVAEKLSQEDIGLPIGQLPESWASVPASNVSIHKKGQGYYIVAVENEAEGKTLFVLMSSHGKPYDANFSGVFPKLK